MKSILRWWCSFLLPLAALAAPRPNFLFILTDDQRWDAMGVVQREQGDQARFPWFKTPNLDRLASGGVRFRNAFVVNSLCAPSRATYMTGRYGHSNGIVNNHTPFTDPQTVASLLDEAGYATGYIGKWHMGSQSGKRPTWGYSASFVGQGRYFNCPIEVDGQTVASTGWVDDVSTDYAVGFLRKNAAAPFLLFVGFKATHGPFEPPVRHAKTFEGETARPVPNLDVPAIYQGRSEPRKPRNPNTNLGYFRALAGMDDNVGRLLDELDRLGLASNTLVVFASDNGYYLGEHGLGDKRTAYEESLRIPLLVRYPPLGRTNTVIDRMALNIDLCPTFLDFAGVSAPTNLHGRSWRPLLEQKTDAPWRDAFFYCYFNERNFGAPMTTAVRTDTAKLIRYPGHNDWTELFDVKADPYETRNLIADPAHAALRKELESAYDREAVAIAFRVPDFADGADPATAAKKTAGILLDYRFDRDKGAKVVDVSGNGCAGDARNAPLVDGREGRKARKFGGKGSIETAKTPAQDPSGGPFSVLVELKADKPDGVVLAHGGRSNGYALFLDGGRPGFVVNSANKTARIAAEKPLPDGWATVEARVTAQKKLELLVDGKVVAKGPLPDFIADDPNDHMQIGADEGSPVLEPLPPRFEGLIGRVTIVRGEARP